AYLNSPSVNTTALKAGYTLLTAPANHVALYFMLTEEEHATFNEINLFYTRAEALAYYMFMISSERVYTENLQRAYLVRYYSSSDNLMHYWSFFVRNWISPTYYLDANEVYNLPACKIEFVSAYRMDFDTALEPLRRFTWTDGKAWDYWCIYHLRQLIGMALATPTDPVSATNERRAHDAAVMALRHIAGYYGLALLNLAPADLLSQFVAWAIEDRIQLGPPETTVAYLRGNPVLVYHLTGYNAEQPPMDVLEED
ncbi:unnamed protein product, partial [Effrenium voratum]